MAPTKKKTKRPTDANRESGESGLDPMKVALPPKTEKPGLLREIWDGLSPKKRLEYALIVAGVLFVLVTAALIPVLFPQGAAKPQLPDQPTASETSPSTLLSPTTEHPRSEPHAIIQAPPQPPAALRIGIQALQSTPDAFTGKVVDVTGVVLQVIGSASIQLADLTQRNVGDALCMAPRGANSDHFREAEGKSVVTVRGKFVGVRSGNFARIDDCFVVGGMR
jgi:hypothetical protein